MDLGFPLTHSRKMSIYISSSSEPHKPCSSGQAQCSSSAAVSSRKQMRPDKERGCHIVCVGPVCMCVFSYCKYGVCSYTSSCFPVPFDLWDNWLGATRAAGLLSGRPEATATDISALLHGRNNREVNHSCLFHRLQRFPRSLAGR